MKDKPLYRMGTLEHCEVCGLIRFAPTHRVLVPVTIPDHPDQPSSRKRWFTRREREISTK